MPGTYQYDLEIKSNVEKLLKDMKQVQDRLDTVEGREYTIKFNIDEKKLSSVISNLEKMLDSLGKGTGDFKQFENLSKELSSIVSEVQSLSKAFGKVDDSGAKTLLSSIQNIDKSLSELSQNILNVNKNMNNMGGNTSGAVKQVENISNAYQDAAKEAEKLADAESKIGRKANISSGMKDTFPKTSENLEQVAQSEQKVQQEAVATDKALDNISFTPNTEGFDDIIAKFGILREQAEQITKIVKTTKQTVDGTNISYKATLRNGSSYYLGENSTPQVLNASETVYNAKAVAKNVEQEAKAIQSKWEQAEKAIQNYMNAVTKLNNLRASDKSTGNKSYEIAGQIEEIEKLKKEAYDARQVLSSMINPQNVDTDTWKRYVDVINRLDQASNGSAESVNRLKDSLKNTLNSELNSLQNSIDKYQNIITQAQIYPSDFHPSTEYNTKLAKLESANEVLKNYKASLQGVTELTKEQQNQINRLTQNCEKAATEFKNLSAAEKGTIKVGVEKAIQRINKDLAENTKYSAEAKAGLNALLEQLKSGDPSINLRKITEEIIKIENAEIAAGRAGKSLWDIFKTKSTYGFIGQMQSYLSMYVGFYGMVNGVKKAVSTIRELDTAYTEMRKVSDESVQSLKNFQKESFSTADSVGTTALAMQDATATWMRLGESLDDAKESAKDATVLLNVSEFDNIDEATDSLVAMSQAYKDLDKMEIIDVLDKIGNEYSISTDQLSTALKDSAAVLKTQGNDLAESVALITAGNAITQDASKTAGETLPERYRNIFYRTYLTARAA